VIVLHDRGGSAETMQQTTGLDAKADQAGFLVVYLNGVDGAFNALTAAAIPSSTSGWSGRRHSAIRPRSRVTAPARASATPGTAPCWQAGKRPSSAAG
jgi:hypothetical protein